jgi:hypothetical protein
VISQYSRKDVKFALDFIFFLSAAIALSTGILLFVTSYYGILWIVFSIGGLFKKITEYIYFFLVVVEKARIFSRKPYMTSSTGGTRAPPPSINDETFYDIQVEPQSTPEPSETVFDPRDRVDADRIINALSPRRQQTFEAPDEDSPRQPSRSDTEANIGL